MSLITVVDILKFDSHPVRGCSVDAPVIGARVDVHAIRIQGWVLGRENRVVAVHVVHEDTVIRTAFFGQLREDVAARYPAAQGAAHSGFSTMFGVVGLPPECAVHLTAVFEDQSSVVFASLHLRHQPLRSNCQVGLRPLLVTTLGRTGSTWLMRLLDEHPAIVAHRLHPYETRAAGYWLNMVKVLTEPADHIHSSHPDVFYHDTHWAGHHPYYMPPITDPPPVHHWFGRAYAEHVAGFCQESIESFYRGVAQAQEASHPVYFAEKCHPAHLPWIAWELYPEAREIILVRDLRDMVCSMLDFYRKTGRVSFGRDKVATDEEFVRRLRPAVLSLQRSWEARRQRACLVRYEDLLCRPTETLRDLLDYLAIDSSSATVDRILERASADSPKLEHHRTSAASGTSMGRWRASDGRLQALFQECFGDVLPVFGYRDPDIAPLPKS